MKTLSVLNPFSTTPTEVIGDSDLAGPLMFCLALGSFLLLVSIVNLARRCMYAHLFLRLGKFISVTSMASALVVVWLYMSSST